ncbi:MAG: TetR/AcrR family transcriptional regulator [Alphaproteobacteria bacterium]|nr:TetR/AcrR family transcriptional regulator [Alphaproteobacteria bacterium]
MRETADSIAEGLERRFAADGFAAPGVDALRAAAGVSLRTLYRHFPSREAMVLGALERRHRRYLETLVDRTAAGGGTEAVRAAFARLSRWMAEEAPTGCLFRNAMAAHPDSDAVRAQVRRHKEENRAAFARLLAAAFPALPTAARDPAAGALFLIQEGFTAAYPTLGPAQAEADARALLDPLLRRLEKEAAA